MTLIRFFVSILIFSIYTFKVYGNDASSFQIEGISIGDSALNFLNRSEIIKQTKKNSSQYSHLKNPNEFGEIYILDNDKFEIYDGISFFVKQSDANFEIRMLRGLIWLDIKPCLAKRDEIKQEIESVIENFEKAENTFKSNIDKLLESKMYNINYYLSSGDLITIQCSDWSERMQKEFNYTSGLSVAISTKDFDDWIRNY